MKKVITSIILFWLIIPVLAFGMGQAPNGGVIIFYNENSIELKANKSKVEDVCDAVAGLTGIKIIVDNTLLNEAISLNISESKAESILLDIVRKIPSASYIKILKSEPQKELESFVIFSKNPFCSEVSNEFFSKRDGLQEAFIAKYCALRVDDKVSVSGIVRLTGVEVSMYNLPTGIKRFADDFIAINKALLDLGSVTLKVKRVGSNYVDYEQYYKDVIVGNLRSSAFQIKHTKDKDGDWIMVSNNTIPNINISVQPKITENEAVELVINEINKAGASSKLYGKKKIVPDSVELKILPQLDIKTDNVVEKFKTMSLYWSVNIDIYNYYVDAKTGTIYKGRG